MAKLRGYRLISSVVTRSFSPRCLQSNRPADGRGVAEGWRSPGMPLFPGGPIGRPADPSPPAAVRNGSKLAPAQRRQEKAPGRPPSRPVSTEVQPREFFPRKAPSHMLAPDAGAAPIERNPTVWARVRAQWAGVCRAADNGLAIDAGTARHAMLGQMRITSPATQCEPLIARRQRVDKSFTQSEDSP